MNRRQVKRYPDPENWGGPLHRRECIMKSKLITLFIGLLVIIVVVGIVTKLVRWAITLAVILGIVAVIVHFVKRKTG